MQLHAIRAASVALAFALGLAGAPGLAGGETDAPTEDAKIEPPGGEVLGMSQFYTGSVAQTGQFPGKLVCLRSDRGFVPASADDCDAAKRVYALQMADDDALRPLIAGNQEVFDQMQSLLGRDVVVTGRYHTNTGMVIASAVLPKETTPVR